MCFLSHLSMCACNYKILSEAVHSPFWAQTDRHIEWDFFSGILEIYFVLMLLITHISHGQKICLVIFTITLGKCRTTLLVRTLLNLGINCRGSWT